MHWLRSVKEESSIYIERQLSADSAATTKVEQSMQKIHLPHTSGGEGTIEAVVRAEAVDCRTPVAPAQPKTSADPTLGLH